jgi:hypothetical protein
MVDMGSKRYRKFYATLAYIRHFIFAGCYDNNPWYLVTNLAGRLDLAVFFFIYRRPTLYPLEIAVDFLKSL